MPEDNKPENLSTEPASRGGFSAAALGRGRQGLPGTLGRPLEDEIQARSALLPGARNF
jgi:hypothetical protein